jgi:hypothetical protein
VKYIMEDDSWLLIRPSGTEPVLRVYAEGRSEQMVEALLGYGEQVAESITWLAFFYLLNPTTTAGREKLLWLFLYT